MAILALTLAACSGSSGTSGTEETDGGGAGTADGGAGLTFEVLVFDTTNPFIATMGRAAETKGEEMGITVNVRNGETDIAVQVSQIQTAIANGVDGIIVQGIDPDGIVPAINQAADAGIPVVSMNAATGEGAEVVTFVGADDYAYGMALGELTAQAIGDQGKVAVIQGIVGSSPEELRTGGIEEVLAGKPDIEIVQMVVDEWINDKNIAAVQDLLTRYGPGEIQAIVAEGPQLYVGAEWAMEQGRDDVKFIAGDYPIQVQESINSGALYGTVLQSPEIQGETAVEVLAKYIDGDTSVVQDNTYIDLPLITAENVDEYDTVWNW